MKIELTKPTLVRSIDGMGAVPQTISPNFMINYPYMGNFQTIPPPPQPSFPNHMATDEVVVESPRQSQPLCINLSLIDDTFQTQFDPSNLFKVIQFTVNEIKKIDVNNVDKYFVRIEPYCCDACGAYISFGKDPDFTGNDDRVINLLSFSLSQFQNFDTTDMTIKMYINSLFLNAKYMNFGSKILDILKETVKMFTNLENAMNGIIELYSVETAVLFYVKNDFIIKQILNKNDPQSDVCNVFRIIEFAMKEDNMELVKKFAGVDQSNFADFVDYLMKNTKYGKFYSAYFDSLPKPNQLDKNVFQSRFISSLFNTNMIWLYKEPSAPRKITVKYLAGY